MTNPTTAMTLRLPTDLYERLRTRAFEERTSMTALIVQAVQTADRAAGIGYAWGTHQEEADRG